MKAVEASAPGKVVLSGEYAVLGGAPAIAMAVNRRARVSLETTTSRCHSVASPGLHDRTLEFRAGSDGSLEWANEAPSHENCALLEQVWRCVQPAPAASIALTLDTLDFFDEPGGSKLGFGSSAALAAALVAAVGKGDVRAPDLYRMAALAHRRFQGGKGSGVDVAAAVHGGLIGFCMNRDSVEKLAWPRGLLFALLWSGKPSSTAEKLARLEASGRERGASATRLAEAATAVLEAWRRCDASSLIGLLDSYTDALQRFSADHDLGVFDAGHAELHVEARARGLVYKPCGAGGGDIGVVFATERPAVVEFRNRAREFGFEPLDILPEARGVLIENRSEH